MEGGREWEGRDAGGSHHERSRNLRIGRAHGRGVEPPEKKMMKKKKRRRERQAGSGE